jgi:hypothetical protein
MQSLTPGTSVLEDIELGAGVTHFLEDEVT